DGRAEARTVDHDARVGFSARDLYGNGGGRIRVVHRIGRQGAEVDGGKTTTAQVFDHGGLEGQRSVVTGDGDRTNIRSRSQHGEVHVGALADHLDPARPQGVLCEGCN